MGHAEIWRNFLVKWPADLPHHGVLITAQEQVAFIDFLLSESLVLFDRRAPDAVGGRKLICTYDKIEGIKIVTPVGLDVFTSSGFRALPKPASKTEELEPVGS
ncbi:MAG: hypothetical protein KDA60_06215 [Planctomycetales bacterium]|nr:hypothetical protein [Planctomycetales bacterium]